MKSLAPQVNVDLVRNHAPGHLGIGNEEYVLVRCAGEFDAAALANDAARAVASGKPPGGDSSIASSGQIKRCVDVVCVLPRG